MNVMFIAFFMTISGVLAKEQNQGQIYLPLIMINATTPQSLNTAV